MTNGIWFGVSGEKIPEDYYVGQRKDSVSYRLWDGYKFLNGSSSTLGIPVKEGETVTLLVDPVLKVARVLVNSSLFLLDSSPFLANSPCFTLSTYRQNDQVEIV